MLIIPRRYAGWVLMLPVLLAIGPRPPALADEADGKAAPATSLNPIADARQSFQGPVGDYLTATTSHWLLPAPTANPAILAMFADRDRQPYRDLLPWSGEFAGKYLTGATQVMRATGDSRLRPHLERFVAELLSQQDEDGYLGPFPKTHRITRTAPNIQGKEGDSWDAWGHYHAMLGLLLWHEATNDPAALEGAKKIADLFCTRFLGEKTPRLVDTGSTEMNLAPAHSLCLLYEKTKEPKYLDMAKQIVNEFSAKGADGKPLAGDYFEQGLAGEEFYKLPKPRWESLHPILAIVELYRITGDERYRKAFTNLWWSIAKLDRHNNGGFSSGEQAQGNPYHRGAIETCCTIAWMAMSVEMLRLTGDPIVADELELSTLNSALGIFSPTGRWSTYNTPMDGDRKANFHDINFQDRPGSPELNCCSVNAARGLGLLSEWALMTTLDGGLTLNWLAPAQYNVSLPNNSRLTLRVLGEYPRSGQVEIRVEPTRATDATLRLRIPHWSTSTKVTVNGEPIEGVRPGMYLDLKRTWNPGDVINLELDLAIHLWAGEQESAGRVSVYRGPILLTYDPRFNPGLPADPPAFDAKTAEFTLVDAQVKQMPIVLVEAKTSAGTFRLCDFASAGYDGSFYRSWLNAENTGTREFNRERPWRTRPLKESQ